MAILFYKNSVEHTGNIEGGQKSKPLLNDEQVVLNRIKACQ